tara:strand:- start:666 stop:1568 length:903 start_codon:yes stop_codon:yes gene_type:complete
MFFLNKIIIIIIPFLPKFVARFFSKKYVAGTTINQALDKIQKLNLKNESATIDILGEHTKKTKEANEITSNYIKIIEKIHTNNLDCNLSIKPSHIGLDISYELALNNFKQILESAKKYGNFIRIDMESSKNTDISIKLYNELKKISSNIGIVFQAYLHRTENDINNIDPRSNIRLCKGIYKESSEISFQNYDEINNNYLHLLELAFKKNIYVGIATHDERLIYKSKEIIKKMKVDNSLFEFQYLYGVPMKKINKKLKNEHFKIRSYVPFGKDWYDYSIRRIKENPQIASYVIKNIFSKGM